MDNNIPKKISNGIVLVVDDDIPSFQLIEELFSELDVTLKHFASGHFLLDWFRDNDRPNLVIMDIQLPGLDGLELTRQIKALDSSVPVIACTSYALPGDRERCLESGCDEYFSKPIDLDWFVTKVSEFLPGS
jgi:two-component system, cell cycle response regulator DivK